MADIQTGKPDAALNVLLTAIARGDEAAPDKFVTAIEPWLRERVAIQAEHMQDPHAIEAASHIILQAMAGRVTTGEVQNWQSFSREFARHLDEHAQTIRDNEPQEPTKPSHQVPAPDNHVPEAELQLRGEVNRTLGGLNEHQRFVLNQRLEGRPLDGFHATRESLRQTQARAIRKVSDAAAEITGGDRFEIRKRFVDAINAARKNRGDYTPD